MRSLDLFCEPDHVDDLGVKWWHLPHVTAYAEQKGIADVRGWRVETRNKVGQFLLTAGSQVIAETTSLEGLGQKIDFMAFVDRQAVFETTYGLW